MQITKLTPRTYKKSQHPMRRKHIPANVLFIIDQLRTHKFKAYVVGGCIRDKLFGIQPKDFDVVTDALPEQIKKIFKNCRLIGRRFRLAHLHFGREIIEVATFRGHHVEDSKDAVKGETGMLVRDNVFGSIEEDAARRDFSFNAMYFDPIAEHILDFAEGMTAVQARQIEMIGDVEERLAEDPVRMIRALRFAAKLGCELTPNLSKGIKDNAHLISNVAPARLFEEVNKIFISGKGHTAFEFMLHFQLMKYLFPSWKTVSASEKSKEYLMTQQMLENTDTRVIEGQRITPAFLYASILWYALEDKAEELSHAGGLSQYDAINIAAMEVLQIQVSRVMIPKRFSVVMREIWSLQYRLAKRSGKRPFQLLSHPRFRAAYDFLLIRAHVEGGKLHELAEWWTKFQEVDSEQRKTMLFRDQSKRRKRRFNK